MKRNYGPYINGAFVHPEGAEIVSLANRRGAVIAELAGASPQELRHAAAAARAAFREWTRLPAHQRARALYALTEAMERARDAFIEALKITSRATPAAARREINTALDRLLAFAGWADKYAAVLGGPDPVAGPYYTFTTPRPIGVVGLVAPTQPALLPVLTLAAAALCAGNTAVLLVESAYALPAMALAECCAPARMPAGVLNIIPGDIPALLATIADEHDVDALCAPPTRRDYAATLHAPAPQTLQIKTSTIVDEQWYETDRCESPWMIEPFVATRTVWHPSAT